MTVVWKLFDGTSTIDFTSATGFRGERGHVTQITNLPGDGSIPEYLTETIPVTIVGTSDDNFAAHLQKFALLQKRAAEYWVDPQQSTPVWYHEKLSAETGERRALVKSLGLAFDQETGSLMSGSPKTTAGKKATLFVERHPYWERTTTRIFPNATPTAAAAVAYDYTAGPELLSNIGFETAGGGGDDIWASWTEDDGDGALANETVFKNGGADACKMTAGATAATFVYQAAIPVIAGQQYTYSFYARGDGTNAGRYDVYDETNAAYITSLTSTGVTAATYALVDASFTVPAGCATIRVLLRCPEANGGICYFDDTTLRLAAHDIVGDVPARIGALTMQSANDLHRLWMGIRSASLHGATGVTGFIPVWECEDGVLNIDGSIYLDSAGGASEANLASPGAGSGDFVVVDPGFASSTWDWDAAYINVQTLSSANVGYTTYTDSYGRFLWLLRAKVTSGTWSIYLRDGYSIAKNYHEPKTIDSTAWNYFEVAINTLPLCDQQGVSLTSVSQIFFIYIYAKRLTGSGDLKLDCFCPVPIDGGFCKVEDGYMDSTRYTVLGEGPHEHYQVLTLNNDATDWGRDINIFEWENFHLPPGDGRLVCVYADTTETVLTDTIEFADAALSPSVYTERWTSLRGAE